MRVEITSGRRRVQGRGAPWEAWAVFAPAPGTLPDRSSVPFGGWGSSREDAERMALRMLQRDREAAQAGYDDVKTRTLDM